jgi:hypothetical protein
MVATQPTPAFVAILRTQGRKPEALEVFATVLNTELGPRLIVRHAPNTRGNQKRHIDPEPGEDGHITRAQRVDRHAQARLNPGQIVRTTAATTRATGIGSHTSTSTIAVFTAAAVEIAVGDDVGSRSQRVSRAPPVRTRRATVEEPTDTS